MTKNTPTARRGRPQRRVAAAASGLAALALVLGACSSSDQDDVDKAVDSATSAVASAASDVTSAVGTAASDVTSAVGTAVDDAKDHEDDHKDKDKAYIDEIRAGGVDVPDVEEEDFIIRGHDACRDLEDGESSDVVIAKYYEAHPEADDPQGTVVVTAAVNHFCPDYLPALNP